VQRALEVRLRAIVITSASPSNHRRWQQTAENRRSCSRLKAARIFRFAVLDAPNHRHEHQVFHSTAFKVSHETLRKWCLKFRSSLADASSP
jgi:hypothetical protein